MDHDCSVALLEVSASASAEVPAAEVHAAPEVAAPAAARVAPVTEARDESEHRDRGREQPDPSHRR